MDVTGYGTNEISGTSISGYLSMTNRYIPTEDEMNFAIKNARNILVQFFNHVSDLDVHFFRNAMKHRRDELYKYNDKEVKDE